MRELTKLEKEELYLHELWIKTNGKEGKQLDWSGRDLSNANLSDSNLSNANLSDSNLSNANLKNANLKNANLSDSDLKNANLSNSNLSDSDLSNSDLINSNLRNSDLINANLSYSYLINVNLKNARNIMSFTAGKSNRRCFAIKHKDCIMFKIGCFWGDTEEAIRKIRQDYGKDSFYEKQVLAYTNELMK